MSNYITILANDCILDATGSPIANGILTVTPSSKFRVGGGGQALGEPIRRIIANGSLTEPLQLADPSLTSPENIGYTFEVVDSSTLAVETYDNVLIVADENGNWNFSTLNTGNFVEGVPTATPDGGITSITVTAPLTNTSGDIALPKATASTDGYLAAADFATFEAKAGALGYTPLNPANNLSDVSSASTARTNLGLGTIATQSSSSVAVTGGAINGTPIGASTAATGAFTVVDFPSPNDAAIMTRSSTGRTILSVFAGIGLRIGESFYNFMPSGLSIGGYVNANNGNLIVGANGQMQVDNSGNVSITSPNGIRFQLAVDNNGNLSATAL